MTRLTKVLFTAASLVAMAGTALAEDEPAKEEGGGGTEAGAGGEATTGGEGTPAADPAADPAMAEGAPPPMILEKGKIGIHVPVYVNLSKDLVGKPISINPDVWYGVMPKLQVGLAHSSMGLTGFWAPSVFGAGGGVCVTGTEKGCEKVYNGPVGVIANYAVMEGSIDVAADAGVIVARLSDPTYLGVKLGVKVRKMSGKIAIIANPNIYIGLTERDAGNKESLFVPVTIGFMASPKLMAGIQTGVAGPLDGFGDAYVLPVALGAKFNVNDKMAVGGAFSLLRVAGFEGPGAADLRSIGVFVDWHN